MLAFAFSIVTIAGVMCAFIVLCSAKFCGDKCGGMLPKCFVFFSFVVFTVLGILYLLMGGALIAVRSSFNEEFVNT